jgi:hypothetical protein
MDVSIRRLFQQALCKTRQAAFCIQKIFRRQQLMKKALTLLMEQILFKELFQQSFEWIWQKEMILFYEAIRPQIQQIYPIEQQGGRRRSTSSYNIQVEEEANELMIKWRQMQKETRQHLKRRQRQLLLEKEKAAAEVQRHPLVSTPPLSNKTKSSTLDASIIEKKKKKKKKKKEEEEEEYKEDTCSVGMNKNNTKSGGYLSDEEDQWMNYLKVLKSNIDGRRRRRKKKKKMRKRETKRGHSDSTLVLSGSTTTTSTSGTKEQKEKQVLKIQGAYRNYKRKQPVSILPPSVASSSPPSAAPRPMEYEKDEGGTEVVLIQVESGKNLMLDTQKYHVSIHIEKEIPIRPHGHSKQTSSSLFSLSPPKSTTSSSSSSCGSDSSTTMKQNQLFDPFKSRLPPLNGTPPIPGGSITTPFKSTQVTFPPPPRLPYIRRKV